MLPPSSLPPDIFPIRSTAELPFRPGQSPFRVKGNVLVHVKEFHDQHVPGGIAAVADAFEDPMLRAFYLTRFLAASWYDLLPIVLIDAAAVRLVEQPAATYFREIGRDLAQRDLKGVHKVLLRFTSPQVALTRFSSVYRQYYSFGATRIIQSLPGTFETLVEGMPAIVAPIQRLVSSAFAQCLIGLAGGKTPSADYGALEPDGERHGVLLVRHRTVTRWQ